MIPLQLPQTDKSWTLFLDRDGVINTRIMGGYARTPEELDIITGVPTAIAHLNPHFFKTVIVTNQRGIAAGLMTEDDLALVHQKLTQSVQEAGGKIDGIYYCPHERDAGCTCRKPRTGLAEQAQEDFPAIDFTKSIMIGDTSGDMELGRKLGMTCVWIDNGAGDKVPLDYDYRFELLTEFAEAFFHSR